MTTVATPVPTAAPPDDTPTPPGPGASIWARLGSFAFRRRRLVLLTWVGLLVGVIAAAGAIGSASDSTFESPDSESAAGFELLGEHFGGAGSFLRGSIVVAYDGGIADPALAGPLDELFTELDAAGDDYQILSPYSPLGQQQGLVAPSGNIAYAPVSFDDTVDDIRSSEVGEQFAEAIEEFEAGLDAAGVTGVQIELGGQALAEFEPPESELIGISFAIVILIVSFGSVLAMGLPIGTALFGVGIGVTLISLLSNVITIPTFATQLGAMIGLGVGIDYALFIVTRYREGTRAGMSRHDAIVRAIDTAGRAVIFAGFTVVISLLGMLLMGLAFISGMAIGAAVTVTVTMIASVTLLPALIALAGERVEVTRWRGLLMAGSAALGVLGVGIGLPVFGLLGLIGLVGFGVASIFVPALRRIVPVRPPKPVRETWSYRWSRFVQRHPWPMALGVSALLVVLSLPLFAMFVGFSDESSFPEDTTTRRAYELLADGFGPGSNGPLLLIGEVDDPAQFAAAQQLVTTLNATDGVAQALGPIPSESQQALQIVVLPTTGPQEEATVELVNALRDDLVPAAMASSDAELFVTGSVAASIDFSDYMSARLPLFFVAVLSLSFLLLMMVFRSILVPLKAVIMNLLSIGGAYGLVVAVFQWGWGVELLGTAAGPIEPFLPMMLFAIVFGLSMDYEVFLLSRVKEEFDRTGDPANSVADGLAATARVISAAAAIMVVVFGSFVLEDQRVIKMFGLGLASAVFLDATLVRMLLVPATMELLGARNWWLPAWLDRLLPTLNVEGGPDEHDATTPADALSDTLTH